MAISVIRLLEVVLLVVNIGRRNERSRPSGTWFEGIIDNQSVFFYIVAQDTVIIAVEDPLHHPNKILA